MRPRAAVRPDASQTGCQQPTKVGPIRPGGSADAVTPATPQPVTVPRLCHAADRRAQRPATRRRLTPGHNGCGGLAGKAELLTGIENVSSRPVRRIVPRRWGSSRSGPPLAGGSKRRPKFSFGNVTHLQGGTGASRVPAQFVKRIVTTALIRARGCRPPAASLCSSDVHRHREGGSCHPRRL